LQLSNPENKRKSILLKTGKKCQGLPRRKETDTESLQKRKHSAFSGKNAVIALTNRGIGLLNGAKGD
jgi:hypothetical protein